MTSRVANKLSPGKIDGLLDGNHGDGNGLSLLITDSGQRRSWVYRFTSPVIGKVREMGLGRAGAGGVSLAEARKERDRLRTEIKGGVDPLEARKEVAEAQRRKAQVEAGKKTLREVAEAFIEEKQRGWGASSRAIWRRFADRDIEPVANVAIESFERDHLKLAVMPLVDAGLIDTARLTQSRIHALLNYAGEHGWRPEDRRFRYSQIAPEAEERHHPALMPEEKDEDNAAIRAAVAKLRASPTMSAMALEFIILTVSRVSEATEATWDEIDLDKALWTIPAARMKMDREHRVPLSDRALELLRALHAVKGKNRHVFPGYRPGQPVARTTVFDQCERVTGGKASPHGWRSTFGTWCDQHGVDTIVSELCLAHTKEALAKAYKRSDLIERRRVVLQQWASWLEGPATAEVIPLAARRAGT